MSPNPWERRDFLKTLLAGMPLLAWDWRAFPRGDGPGQAPAASGTYDAVVIGAGLGGLSAAAAFARQGFKVIVLEQHSVPGGYASAFTRPGGFTFDVSLHSTSVGIRNGVANLIQGFPEIQDVVFSPHKPLYRAVFPDYDIRVPHKDLPGYIQLLKTRFPGDGAAIDGIFADMKGLTDEVGRVSNASPADLAAFPQKFPLLFKNMNRTWGHRSGWVSEEHACGFQGLHYQRSRQSCLSHLQLYLAADPGAIQGSGQGKDPGGFSHLDARPGGDFNRRFGLRATSAKRGRQSERRDQAGPLIRDLEFHY